MENNAQLVFRTYSYDSKTGNQTLVDYSDSTPDISFTYNRLGQQRNIVDAAGTRTFYYNDKLQQSSEAISGLYSETISRNYQADGRYSGFTTGKGHVNAGQYDLKGRFAKLFPAGSQSTPFVYNYASTGELTSITHAGGLERKFMLESNRNFIASVENKFNSTVVSKFDYVNDEIGRRSSVTKTGTAFSQNDTINYTYNDRSEVVGAVAVNDSSYNYDYSFDNLGNRTSFASDETGTQTVTNYQTNELNQYTSISVPQSLITPVFDADGNQTQLSNSKGSWNLVYNAENRIIEMTSDTQKLEFVYDYMGRRVSKKVYQKDGTNNYQLKTNNSFIYDGYLLIEILDGANEGLKQTFTWNGNEAICTDVYENNSSERYFYTHDANKNVSELIGSTGAVAAHYEYSPFGKVVKSTFSTPDSGLINPFRFSNEFHDNETGLVYYNYRYYNPELGRWTKRDPIEEQGGLSLYNFVGNNAVQLIDYLGLETHTIWFHVGHSSSAEDRNNALKEEYKDKKKPSFTNEKHCYISCFRKDRNNDLEKILPNSTFPNANRKNSVINPNSLHSIRKKKESVTQAILNEFKAVEAEAKRWCNGKCEGTVKIKLKALDKDGRKYIKGQGWKNLDVIRTYKCAEFSNK